MKIEIEANGITVVAHYEGGRLSLVTDQNGDPLKIGLTLEGRGFTLSTSSFLMTMKVCDARYAHIPSLGIHIPYHLYVQDENLTNGVADTSLGTQTSIG